MDDTRYKELERAFRQDVVDYYGNIGDDDLYNALVNADTDFHRVGGGYAYRTNRLSYSDFLKDNPHVLKKQRDKMILNALLDRSSNRNTLNLQLMRFVTGQSHLQDKTAEILFEGPASVLYDQIDDINKVLDGRDNPMDLYVVYLYALHTKYGLSSKGLNKIVLSEAMKYLFPTNTTHSRMKIAVNGEEYKYKKYQTPFDKTLFIDSMLPDYFDNIDRTTDALSVKLTTKFICDIKEVIQEARTVIAYN